MRGNISNSLIVRGSDGISSAVVVGIERFKADLFVKCGRKHIRGCPGEDRLIKELVVQTVPALILADG